MSKLWSKGTIPELLFLAMVLWVAHFWSLPSLGLYEDDYSHISRPLGWQLSDLLQHSSVLVTWPLGRPLGFFITYFLAFVGGKLGGLSTIYIIGFLIQTTNAVLFYFLLSRLGFGTTALVGALVFGLFPADTTHTFLTHALGLHTSLTFLLIASHLYLSGRKTSAHVISLGCLLTYESPYLLFLAIPVLCQPWDKKLVREMIRHAAVWLGIILAVAAVRALRAEGRIEAVGSSPESVVTTIKHILAGLVIGPATSLGMFWNGPGWALSHWNRELTLVFVVCASVMAWMLSTVRAASHVQTFDGSFAPHVWHFGIRRSFELPIPDTRSIQLPLTALLMLSLAYGFSFTHFPPTATYGRGTSVHLAAAFGGALLFAWISLRLLNLAQSLRLGNVGIALLSLYLSLTVAYRFAIQQDFVKAWQNEQRFWSSAVALTPDLTDGTIILVMDHDLPATFFIQTNSWTDPIMLEQIYQFPAAWNTSPRLFVVPSDWAKSVVREGDQLVWQVPATTQETHWETLPDSNVILMEMENGRLVRLYGSLMIHRQSLQLKPLPLNAISDWKKGILYPLLISTVK